jgi:hypothetical protein
VVCDLPGNSQARASSLDAAGVQITPQQSASKDDKGTSDQYERDDFGDHEFLLHRLIEDALSRRDRH